MKAFWGWTETAGVQSLFYPSLGTKAEEVKQFWKSEHLEKRKWSILIFTETKTKCLVKDVNVSSLPLSDAREENPLVVEMLSSSCCERLSLISLTKEKPVEKGPGAEEVEGWEKRLLEAPIVWEEASIGVKWRWERLRGGLESTYSWKFRDARLVEGSEKLSVKLSSRIKKQKQFSVKTGTAPCLYYWCLALGSHVHQWEEVPLHCH